MIDPNSKTSMCVFKTEQGQAAFFPVNNKEVLIAIFEWEENVEKVEKLNEFDGITMWYINKLKGFSFIYKFKNTLAENGVIHVMNPIKNKGMHRFYNTFSELDSAFREVVNVNLKRNYNLVYKGFQNFG